MLINKRNAILCCCIVCCGSVLTCQVGSCTCPQQGPADERRQLLQSISLSHVLFLKMKTSFSGKQILLKRWNTQRRHNPLNNPEMPRSVFRWLHLPIIAFINLSAKFRLGDESQRGVLLSTYVPLAELPHRARGQPVWWRLASLLWRSEGVKSTSRLLQPWKVLLWVFIYFGQL